jgi:lipoprotein-releasing system ATP-binding protein
MESQIVLQATGISKQYGTLQVLRQVSLTVNRGEIVSIIGPSGAGKTTLLQIIGTLDKADSGQVRIKDQNLADLTRKRLADFRNRHIGFVFQFHHLLPEFTALENVMLPALIKGDSRTAARQKARSLMDYLGIIARETHKPGALSGGEQQRVAVARALVNDPAVVLADEPSGNLDSVHAGQLHQLFRTLSRERSQTFVIVTHNPDLAAMSDRVITLRDGQIAD